MQNSSVYSLIRVESFARRDSQGLFPWSRRKLGGLFRQSTVRSHNFDIFPCHQSWWGVAGRGGVWLGGKR